MRSVTISGRDINGSAALHAAIAAQLAFPDWYGRNLDALYDLLTEPGERLFVTVTDSAALRERLGGYFDRFLRVLSDAGAAVDLR